VSCIKHNDCLSPSGNARSCRRCGLWASAGVRTLLTRTLASYIHTYAHTRARQLASKALADESPVVSLGEMVSLSARKVHADSAVANQVAAFSRG
jgi:hypothetical protein